MCHKKYQIYDDCDGTGGPLSQAVHICCLESSVMAGLNVCAQKFVSATATRYVTEPLKPSHAHIHPSPPFVPPTAAAASTIQLETPEPPTCLKMTTAPEVSAFTAWISCSLWLLHLDVPAGPQICQRRQISFSLPHFSVSLGMLIILGLSTNHSLPLHPTTELLPNSGYSTFASLVHCSLCLLESINPNQDNNDHKLWKMTPVSDNCQLHYPHLNSMNTSDAYKMACPPLHSPPSIHLY